MSNEIELIPELRFPEFEKEGEWEIKELQLLADRVTDKNKSGKIDKVFTNSAAHGIVDQREYFDKDIANKSNLENYYIVENGDYVYNPRISTEAPVGPTSRNNTGRTGVMSPLYTVFRFKEKKNQFYEYYFISQHWYDSIRKASNTGARFDRMSITDSVFMSIPVLYPNPQEQQKIASCLLSLDELIAAHNDKLDALKDHKKGLLQNLFPQEGETVPKVRFPEFEDDGEWEIRSVEQNIDLISGIALKSKELSDNNSGTPILRGINITEGQIRHSDEMDKFYLGDTSEMEKYLIQENDIVIGMDGSKVGKNVALISEQDAGAILIQRVARIRAINSDVRYLYQHFFSNVFRRYVDNVNTSSGIPHISAKQIRDFEIGFPPKIEEQQKIASCLSAVDELITAQQEKIDELQQHKKGLMQGLFPKIES